MTRLAVRLGGDPLTLQGLPGVGDLVLTCTGELSRNRAVGMKVSQGARLEAMMEARVVAEGIRGSRVIRLLAKNKEVEMPIVESVHSILFGRAVPTQIVERLLGRPLRHELDAH